MIEINFGRLLMVSYRIGVKAMVEKVSDFLSMRTAFEAQRRISQTYTLRYLSSNYTLDEHFEPLKYCRLYKNVENTI